MKSINAELPEAIYKQVLELSIQENIPVERLVSMALAQALGVWSTQTHFKERSLRGNREKFISFMVQVHDTKPEKEDQL